MQTATLDPIAVLLDEHVTALARFDALDRALTAVRPDDQASVAAALGEARATMHLLSTTLETHIEKEETPLFPLVRQRLPADDRLIEEMIAEHDQIRIRRDGLATVLRGVLDGDHAEVRDQREAVRAVVGTLEGAPLDATWLAALRRAWRAAAEVLRVHFANEEELVFPLARSLLSAEELEAAALEMRRIDVQSARPDIAPPPAGAAVRVREVLAGLLAEAAAAPAGHVARTLVQSPAASVVLIGLRAGGGLPAHRAAVPITIQAVGGTVQITAAGATVTLADGDLIALPGGIVHDVAARSACGVLVTLAKGAAESV